jgi:hypothetical protein
MISSSYETKFKRATGKKEISGSAKTAAIMTEQNRDPSLLKE